MPLGTDVVGLGPGDIVLDGDPAPPTERATAASPLSRFTDTEPRPVAKQLEWSGYY